MSFIGKILVVMQLVLSICLMAFAAAVSTYQTNWKVKTEAVQKQLDQKSADYAKLEQESKGAADKFNLDKKALDDKALELSAKISQLEGQVKLLAADNKSLSDKSAQTQQITTDLTDDSVARQAEVKLVREKLKLALEDRDKEYKAKAALEDKIFEQDAKIERFSTQNKTLLAQTQQYRDVLLSRGLPTELEEYQRAKTAPPKVFGEVLEARKAKSGGDMLLSISLGENDGLAVDNVLFVYRKGETPKFLGKAKVLSLQADSAVCQLFDRAGTVEKGDHVATKLN